jgi:predicted NUDIX family NTP pyrophosphohydrolase
MSVRSCGILLYRYENKMLQVMLAHPGGPFWAKKDEGAWSIPKGIVEGDEEPLAAAKREFGEETGHEIDGDFIDLGELKQPSRKIVHAWAIERDFDVHALKSNTFSLEWPKHSGNVREYPEIDRAEWFGIGEAKTKILKGQAGFIDRLAEITGYIPSASAPEAQ